MSEQLPDIHVAFGRTEGGVLFIQAATPFLEGKQNCWDIYTPHSKLQEAEDVIDDLICDERACLSCGLPLYKDDRWHEGHHKTYCTLAPYMRKRSTTNE